MTTLTQLYTVAEHGKGDCWRTAIACVLGKTSPDEVPDFDRDNWYLETCNWVKQEGFELLSVRLDEPVEDEELEYLLDTSTYVLSGISPRTYPDGRVMRHSCVGQQRKVAWDPHPERTGITEIEYATLFIPIKTA